MNVTGRQFHYLYVALQVAMLYYSSNYQSNAVKDTLESNSIDFLLIAVVRVIVQPTLGCWTSYVFNL